MQPSSPRRAGPAADPPEVRAATVGDRGALLRLLAEDRGARGLPADPDVVERTVEFALANGSAAWLLVVGRAGMTWGLLLANPALSHLGGGPILRVESVFVPPERRRRGAARALLDHVIREARGYGVARVELDVVAGDVVGESLARDVGAKPGVMGRWSIELGSA